VARPVTRRFVSPDPFGMAAGVNQYAYAGGDPIEGSDPSGLCKAEEIMGDEMLDDNGVGYHSCSSGGSVFLYNEDELGLPYTPYFASAAPVLVTAQGTGPIAPLVISPLYYGPTPAISAGWLEPAWGLLELRLVCAWLGARPCHRFNCSRRTQCRTRDRPMQSLKELTNGQPVRLSWAGGLSTVLGTLLVGLLFYRLGVLALVLPTVYSTVVIAFAVAMRWQLRRHAWFWITMMVIAALHVTLILLVP
jgi:hypothetical protein